MNNALLDINGYTSAAFWRRPEQLRGLIKNHADIVSARELLHSEVTSLFASRLSLHNTEMALAVGLSPIASPSNIGLVALGPKEANLRHCGTARWLTMPDTFQVASLAWHSDILYVGSSCGQVLLSRLNCDDVSKGSCPLHVDHSLATEEGHVGVGELSSSPGWYSSSAMVRSVSASDVGTAALTACCGCHGMKWDVDASALPVSVWTLSSSSRMAPIMFTRWAPGSEAVILAGNYSGSLALVDTRQRDSAHCYIVHSQSDEGGNACVSGVFNPLLNYVIAVGSADGTLSTFDIRHTREAIHRIPSLQGSLTSVQWVGLHSDLISTGGIDGSVSLWNLRCPPTFCVGRSQYDLPVQDLAATQTFSSDTVFGITLGGELTQTSLSMDAMLGLSVSLYSTRRQTQVPVTADSQRDAEMLSKEYEAAGLIYTHQVEKGFELLADCAEWRFARKEADAALQLVELAEPFVPIQVSYDDVGEQFFFSSHVIHSVAQEILNQDILRSSRQVLSNAHVQLIKDISFGNDDDIRRLKSIRLNASLQQLLETKRLEQIFSGYPAVLQLLRLNPELFEFVDADTVCDTVAFALRMDAVEGERFVKLLLSLLEECDAEGKGSRLVRLVLHTAQKPLITAGKATRHSRRFEEKFYRDLDEAKDAVLTQLRMMALGVDRYPEVIALAEGYQANCVEIRQPGMFGWLTIKPLLLYLNCLIAESNYVTFLWTSVQYIETFSGFSGVQEIEKNLFAAVDQLYFSGQKLASRLEHFADLTSFEAAQLKSVRALLKSCHHYLFSILRVQLECENVAIESQMHELPAVMERTLDALMSATEELLNAWAALVDALIGCSQHRLVRTYCLSVIQEFSFRVEDLVEISSKGENDDCLNDILDTCDAFLDTISPPL